MLPEVPYKGSDGGIIYFTQLQQKRPDLFQFKASGDKWQVVHGWMRKHRLVSS